MNDPKKSEPAATETKNDAEGEVSDQDLQEVAGGIRGAVANVQAQQQLAHTGTTVKSSA